MNVRRLLSWIPGWLLLSGCSSHPPLPTVDSVDLERFMGDWYVLAHIPASVEREAFNGVESYRLGDDGRTVETTYTFRKGGFDGAVEVLQPTGYVENTATNATWGMQFFWPFWSEYLISYLADDYTATIIARTARDYVWIMARSPEIDAERFDALVAEVGRQGYDVSKLRRVPQRWPDPGFPVVRQR
ncbi:MAG: lipocalin family protein [Planctomycetes bacterium]|nr:lipocalin family protein [Planctomycetota bacterium]